MSEETKVLTSTGGGVNASPRASENISSPYVWVVDGAAKFEAQMVENYNVVLNSGHDNRYYGYVRGARWIGEWVTNPYNFGEFYVHRGADSSRYETVIRFNTSAYNGKTMKVYDRYNNLLHTFTISGNQAYASKSYNDPLGIKPAGMKYWNIVIE